MINYSNYDLKKEFNKVKFLDLAMKLLSFNLSQNKSEIITEQEVNELYNSLNNVDYLKLIFKKLNNYRAVSQNMTERAYNIVCNIFNKCLDYLLDNRDEELESLIVILSQTFFYLDNNNKIYLQNRIKKHMLFDKLQFWENHLNILLNEEIGKLEAQNSQKKIYSPKIYTKKINEIVFMKIVPLINYMFDFDQKKEKVIAIINPIIEKYNLDDNSKAMIFSFLNDKFK